LHLNDSLLSEYVIDRLAQNEEAFPNTMITEQLFLKKCEFRYQKCACGRAKWLGGLASDVVPGTAIADCLSIDISGDFDGGRSSPVEVAECPVAETAAS
jgi:hypothetical protein